MVIVSGHLVVDPAERASYLEGCVSVVEAARRAEGCLDFAICADPVDASRINVYERWDSQEAVEAFRGSGVSEEQEAEILSAAVSEYDVSDERVLQ